jgi:hypothetical protein
MIHSIPSYHDYIRDKAGPIGHCLACGYNGPMASSSTGYECPVCHTMRLEFCLRDGRVYCQFQPMECTLTSCEKTSHGFAPAA